jgi:hypothetical protein
MADEKLIIRLSEPAVKLILALLGLILSFSIWAFLDLRSEVKQIQDKTASKEDISTLRDEIRRELDKHTEHISKRIDDVVVEVSRMYDKKDNTDTKAESKIESPPEEDDEALRDFRWGPCLLEPLSLPCVSLGGQPR